jgi:hypothetical protein
MLLFILLLYYSYCIYDIFLLSNKLTNLVLFCQLYITNIYLSSNLCMHIYLSTYVLCRLMVGWIWEEFIIGLFTLITEELSGSKHVDTIVSIVLTVGIICLVYGIQYHMTRVRHRY